MSAIAVFGSAQIPDYYEVLEEKEWRQVFSEIATQSVSENIITIKGEERIVEHEILYLVDAISRFWNLTPEIPRLKPGHKKEFQHAGRIYYNLMSLIGAVWNRTKSGYIHPAFWFRDVYLEAEATTPFRGKDDDSDGPATATVGKDQVIRLVKSQNGALRKRELDDQTGEFINPFSRPATRMLFDLAMKYSLEYVRAGEEGGFYRSNYLPFINARTEALKWWERHGILCIVHDKKTYMSVKSHGFREFNPTRDVKGLRA